MLLSDLPRSQAQRSPIQLLTAIAVPELYENANQFNYTNEQFDQSKARPKELTDL